MENKRILMVEDDEAISLLNERALTRASGGAISCVNARTLHEARIALRDMPEDFDMVILDRMLPDGDGLDLIDEIKAVSRARILILSGRNTTKDVIDGINRGGHNYLVKPYDYNEMCARVMGSLREEEERRKEELPRVISRGALTVDLINGHAFLSGEDMMLTPKLFSLLRLFAQHENEILEAEYIYDKVWNRPMAGDLNAIKIAVSRLRAELENSGYTVTAHRGKGYCFESESFY